MWKWPLIPSAELLVISCISRWFLRGLSLVLVVMQCILVSCKSKPWYALLDCQYYAVPLLEMFVVEYKWLLTQKMFVVCQCYVSICWNVECLLADVDNTYHLSHFWLPIAHFYSEEIHTFKQQLTLFCNSLLYDGACQLWLLHAYPSIHNKSYS